MKFKFQGDFYELRSGIEIIANELLFETSEDGIPVRVEKIIKDQIEVIFHHNHGIIRYNKKIRFFRALGLLIEGIGKSNSFEIIEEPQFDMSGIMFDMSRNAVFTVKSIKKMLRKMAIMGLTSLMLYTEDTYEIEDEPYFGYMRGRYSFGELKECDDYADTFGIEMSLCIQTLAHLEQFLKWDAAKKYRDTSEVLFVGQDETYRLIEKMISAATAPFRSKRIHIGMDEAQGLGRGGYLDLHGFQNRFEIIATHLERVLAIATRHNLKPMIWSDMYFRIASSTRDYYDLEAVVPAEVKQNIPPNVQLVYWDYYHDDEQFYDEYIKRHQEFGSNPVFAGGFWTFAGLTTNYGKTFTVANAGLTACKKQGVREVFATVWGDDSENNYFSSLLGLQLYAEHSYAKNVNLGKLQQRFRFCTGIDFDALMDLKYFNEIPGATFNDHNIDNSAKCLLWQDILLGLFDKHLENLELTAHYAKLEAKFHEYQEQYPEWLNIFEVPEKLASVLQLKWDLGVRIRLAYQEKDNNLLIKIMEYDLPVLAEKVRLLWLAHRTQWLETYKPFGWEALDIRYGGVLTRIDSIIKRLKDYLEQRIDKIEELEEERLYFDGINRPQAGVGIGFCDRYYRIVTPNCFSFGISDKL
jgi:hexosaminidase